MKKSSFWKQFAIAAGAAFVGAGAKDVVKWGVVSIGSYFKNRKEDKKSSEKKSA